MLEVHRERAAALPLVVAEVRGVDACVHGDPYCPCQDGDTCHYEGDDPMRCPTTDVIGCTACHYGAAYAFDVEGARVGIVSCKRCGAALLLQPVLDVMSLHDDQCWDSKWPYASVL